MISIFCSVFVNEPVHVGILYNGLDQKRRDIDVGGFDVDADVDTIVQSIV